MTHSPIRPDESEDKMDTGNQNDIGKELDAEIAAADGLMMLVLVLVVMGGVILVGVSALIGAL